MVMSWSQDWWDTSMDGTKQKVLIVSDQPISWTRLGIQTKKKEKKGDCTIWKTEQWPYTLYSSYRGKK